MKKNVLKRNVVVSAMLTIVLCVSIIAGATYALFTSESKVDVAITSGKVDVVASVDEGSIYTKALKTEYEQGLNHMFGGLVSFKEDGTVTLNNVVPGDAVKFTIVVKNNSSISVKYRTIIVCEENNGLFEALKVTINGTPYDGTTKVTDYETLAVDSGDQEITVEIELPEGTENDYQEKEVKFAYKVEAVQGNADTEPTDENVKYIANANDLKVALDNPGNPGGAQAARYVVLVNDIDMSNWTALNGSTNHPGFTIIGNGYTLKNLSAPLFDNFPAKDVTVKNVNFDSANIETTGTNYAGVLIGIMNSSGGGTYLIENCNITNSNIKGYKYAGGFVGFAAEPVNGATGSLTFKNCKIENTNISTDDSSCGGLIGHTYIETTIEKCQVLGNSTIKCAEDRKNDNAKAGSFVGTVYSNTLIKNSSVDSTVTLTNINAKAPIANGFAGRIYRSLTVDGTTYVTNETELLAVLYSDLEEINVVLVNSIDCNLTTGIGSANTKEVNISGLTKDVTLNITCASASYNGSYVTFRTINPDAVMNFSNITLDKSAWCGTTWNTYNIEFYTDVTLTDCIIEHPVTFCEKAVVNNTTINGYRDTAEHYAIWICAYADVTINGGEINGTRGIKMDSEYTVDYGKDQHDTAETKLSVTGTKFKSTKKSAILVKLEWATVNVSNVNIVDVVADNVNPVWIDSDAPTPTATAKLVININGITVDNTTIVEQ